MGQRMNQCPQTLARTRGACFELLGRHQHWAIGAPGQTRHIGDGVIRQHLQIVQVELTHQARFFCRVVDPQQLLRPVPGQVRHVR